MADLALKIEAEIIAFHDFFVEWFGGRTGRDALGPHMAARLAPGFTIIPPNGAVMTRKALLSGFEGLYGSNPNIRIKVRDVVVRHHTGDHVVASYTEWQRGGDANTGRQSTVVMTDAAPFRWLSVHETWLPPEVVSNAPFDF